MLPPQSKKKLLRLFGRQKSTISLLITLVLPLLILHSLHILRGFLPFI